MELLTEESLSSYLYYPTSGYSVFFVVAAMFPNLRSVVPCCCYGVMIVDVVVVLVSCNHPPRNHTHGGTSATWVNARLK